LFPSPLIRAKREVSMDPTRCPHCTKRMKAVATSDGRTGLQCLECDKIDPLKTDAVKWAASALTAPTKAA
jgi:tRNA(Ile2) C34 agmatinyltransferase TiaS